MSLVALRKIIKDNRGVATVLVALMMTVLAGMAALSIDVGILYNHRRHLQTAADAGALAGANAFNPKDKTAVNASGVYLPVEKAEAVAGQNVGSAVAVTASANTDQMTVTVVVRQSVDVVFGRVLGFHDFAVAAKASARKMPVSQPTEKILPLAIKDPRYDKDGLACLDQEPAGAPDGIPEGEGCVFPVETDDGTLTGKVTSPALTDNDVWEILDEVGGGDDGYLELRYSPNSNETGNFAPIAIEPEAGDPCEGKNGANLYECQLEYGAYLDAPDDPEDTVEVALYLDTKTGNVANATFDGIQARFAAALLEDSCTPASIAATPDDYTQPSFSSGPVAGTPPAEFCPLAVVAPLIKAWSIGGSSPVEVTGWVAIGLIGVCDDSGDDPFEGAPSSPTYCKQQGGTALIMAKFLEPTDIPRAVGSDETESETGLYTVKLIE